MDLFIYLNFSAVCLFVCFLFQFMYFWMLPDGLQVWLYACLRAYLNSSHRLGWIIIIYVFWHAWPYDYLHAWCKNYFVCWVACLTLRLFVFRDIGSFRQSTLHVYHLVHRSLDEKFSNGTVFIKYHTYCIKKSFSGLDRIELSVLEGIFRTQYLI